MSALFRLSEQQLNPAALRAELLAADCGACVIFEGWVRDHHQGRAVQSLDYQAYPELAEREGGMILAEALQSYDVRRVLAVHRVGALRIGDLAVWVGVSAGHRDAAYEASRWIIDEIKAHVPIWKREHYLDGISDWLHP